MNQYINRTQEMDICKDCPVMWGRQRRIQSETWMDEETKELCNTSTFEIVCEHANACRRVLRLVGKDAENK